MERIEKLAQYVAQTNGSMEHTVMERQRGNPEFAFLFGGEGAGYYRTCLERFSPAPQRRPGGDNSGGASGATLGIQGSRSGCKADGWGGSGRGCSGGSGRTEGGRGHAGKGSRGEDSKGGKNAKGVKGGKGSKDDGGKGGFREQRGARVDGSGKGGKPNGNFKSEPAGGGWGDGNRAHGSGTAAMGHFPAGQDGYRSTSGAGCGAGGTLSGVCVPGSASSSDSATLYRRADPGGEKRAHHSHYFTPLALPYQLTPLALPSTTREPAPHAVGMAVDEARVASMLNVREGLRARLDFDAADDIKEQLLQMGVCPRLFSHCTAATHPPPTRYPLATQPPPSHHPATIQPPPSHRPATQPPPSCHPVATQPPPSHPATTQLPPSCHPATAQPPSHHPAATQPQRLAYHFSQAHCPVLPST